MNFSLAELGYKSDEELKQTIYDLLRTIKDPEKPSTLEVRKFTMAASSFAKKFCILIMSGY